MTEQTPANTYTYPVAGRDIVCRHPRPGQLIMARRQVGGMLKRMDATGDPDEVTRLGLRIQTDLLDLIESLIVDADDLDYVRSKLLTGVIEIEDIAPIVRGGKNDDDDEPGDDQPPKPARAPRKPVAKAAARRGRR